MLRGVVAVLVAVAVGCGSGEAIVDESNDTSRTSSGITYEQFKTQFAYWDQDRQLYIADGDIVIADEKLLQEFYLTHVKEGQLIVNRVGSSDDAWDVTRRQNLSYCISDAFGARKDTIVNAMRAAAQSWMDAANIKFVYVPAQDANCTRTNNAVLFNVRPINAGGQYIAAAFFPSNGRSSRELVVDSSIYGPNLSVTGVLRHELGHVLGFRHEHTRPEAGRCFENNAWRALTPYDSASVMHYPQCNGTGSFLSLALTARDIQGVQSLYGAPSTNPPPPPAGSKVENFTASLARGASQAYGPFPVAAGTLFRATLSGTGDGDVYVRFGSAPTASSYNCRPYLSSSAEECRLTPSANTAAYVTVVGFTAANVALEVEYTAP
jgi:serine protease